MLLSPKGCVGLLVLCSTSQASQQPLRRTDTHSSFLSTQTLRAFNESVNGALIKIVPYGQPCYRATYDADACQALAEQNGDDAYRLALPGGVMFTNWEQAQHGNTSAGCPVPGLDTNGTAPDPVQGECTLGGMPAFVVNASSVDDVVETVKFAAKYNLEFRIKNTGHDYVGRSTESGAFTLWTQHLKDAALVRDFGPEGCNASPHDVVSAGPGLTVRELYQFGGDNGVVTIGGFDESVGATGGYLLGGGLGPLGPLFGMAVDNVVQFEVVIATGEIKIVNECTNSDLFWALRGGGGAFAVVIRTWLKAYPSLEVVNTIAGQIGCANSSAYKNLISTMVDLQLTMREQGHTGIWESDATTLGLVLLSIQPLVNSSVDNTTTPFKVINALSTIPGCEASLQSAKFSGSSSWNDAYNGIIWPVVKTGSQVGVNLIDLSRIISYDMVRDQGEKGKMVDFILNTEHTFIWQNAIDGPTRNPQANSTSVHPAWGNAFAYMNTPVFGPWKGITQQQKNDWVVVRDAADQAFGTAAYYNEDYELEVDWRESFFGSNYQRLLEIKKQWDPNDLFRCRTCVGADDTPAF